MSDESPIIDLRMQISAEQADDFLYRATHDPDFRARVEADPAGVLGEYGIDVAPETVPHLAQLPAPEDIQSLRSQLGSGDEHAPVGSARPGSPWFVAMIWFASIPKPGGDAAS